MRILFVAAEAAPVIKVGGLGDVVGSLSKELKNVGHDVRIIIPKYSTVDGGGIEYKSVLNGYTLPQSGESINLLETIIQNKVKTYFIENNRRFNGDEVYGNNELDDFLFFSRAVLEVLPGLDWKPEIIHCHDWHTSLVPMIIKKHNMPYLTVLTIHNLAHQGWFDKSFLKTNNLQLYWDSYPSGISGIPHSFLGQGILNSDFITTVSESYARDILTWGNGEGLDEILQLRENRIAGILNGIDYEEYDPESDKYLAKTYNHFNLVKRSDNKIALQGTLGLKQSKDVPLIGLVQRLDEQKGIDIFTKALDSLLENSNIQCVILGKGRDYYENYIKNLSLKYPDKLAVRIGYDNELAHLIYGCCDMIVVPSRFEPCGLSQLIAMRYGAIPVVRHTGGLADTVPPFNEDMTNGNGFVFYQYSSDSLLNVMKFALQKIRNREAWLNAVTRIMQIDFSWKKSAERYDAIYHLINN